MSGVCDAGLQLTAILVTHHHPDHIGGVDALRDAAGAAVYGPARDIPGPFDARRRRRDHALGLRFHVFDVPGHTAGHIAYYDCSERGRQAPAVLRRHAVFGRLRPPVRGHAGADAGLAGPAGGPPADTRVCCTHEYTLGNLKFATAVEPGNPSWSITGNNARKGARVAGPRCPPPSRWRTASILSCARASRRWRRPRRPRRGGGPGRSGRGVRGPAPMEERVPMKKYKLLALPPALALAGCATRPARRCPRKRETSCKAASAGAAADRRRARGRSRRARCRRSSPRNSARSRSTSLEPPPDLWERIRRGFRMPDLDSDLVRIRSSGTRPAPTTSSA